VIVVVDDDIGAAGIGVPAEGDAADADAGEHGLHQHLVFGTRLAEGGDHALDGGGQRFAPADVADRDVTPRFGAFERIFASRAAAHDQRPGGPWLGIDASDRRGRIGSPG